MKMKKLPRSMTAGSSVFFTFCPLRYSKRNLNPSTCTDTF